MKKIVIEYDENDPKLYSKTFDKENLNWTDAEQFTGYNWMFLRHQQNWANDILRARGHLFLNEIYTMLGLPRTEIGAVVGWVYKDPNSYVDFGCWEEEGLALKSIELNFNVDGPIVDLIEKLK